MSRVPCLPIASMAARKACGQQRAHIRHCTASRYYLGAASQPPHMCVCLFVSTDSTERRTNCFAASDPKMRRVTAQRASRQSGTAPLTYLTVICHAIPDSTKVRHTADQRKLRNGHLARHVPGIAAVQQALSTEARWLVGQLTLAAPQLAAGSTQHTACGSTAQYCGRRMPTSR